MGQLVRAYVDFFNFRVRQELSPNNLNHINCVVDAFSARFHGNLFGAAVEQGDAGKDIVHDWFASDQHRVRL
jgi:hypothetical protein